MLALVAIGTVPAAAQEAFLVYSPITCIAHGVVYQPGQHSLVDGHDIIHGPIIQGSSGTLVIDVITLQVPARVGRP
ncbi:MAG: hypothetical protein HKN27_14965 [Silicimonas sp.]|nr:hypothetical protein [Silicimonas sp.]